MAYANRANPLPPILAGVLCLLAVALWLWW
mgnify:CR=1 FL=1